MISSKTELKLRCKDLELFPGQIAKLGTAFEEHLLHGWGRGFSGKHFEKICEMDPSALITTWAEVRQEQFSRFKFLKTFLIKPPLPCDKDGNILTDKLIRKKVSQGQRLIFCPITRENFDPRIPFFQEESLYYCVSKDIFLKQIEDHLPDKPYWFWIDGREEGETYCEAFKDKFPLLIEYLLASHFLKEELGQDLGQKKFVWLKTSPEITKASQKDIVVFGGNPIRGIFKSQIEAAYDFAKLGESSISLHMRLVERL